MGGGGGGGCPLIIRKKINFFGKNKKIGKIITPKSK
eukprot:SAG11_NODE_7845_length_1089_cov_1.718182_1_plen_35_part_10